MVVKGNKKPLSRQFCDLPFNKGLSTKTMGPTGRRLIFVCIEFNDR